MNWNLWAVSLAAVGSVAAARGISWLIEMLGGYRVVRAGLLEFLAYRNARCGSSAGNVLAAPARISQPSTAAVFPANSLDIPVWLRSAA